MSQGRLYREQVICLPEGSKSKQSLQDGGRLRVWESGAGGGGGGGGWYKGREKAVGGGIKHVGGG